MRPTLTVNSGPAAGRSLPIEGQIVIGRSAADLTIEDPELSRRHAAVRPTERGFVIEDLGSTNGTFVNGRRISEPVTVTTGATIEVGSSRIALDLPPDSMTRVRVTPIAPSEQPTRAVGVVQEAPSPGPATAETAAAAQQAPPPEAPTGEAPPPEAPTGEAPPPRPRGRRLDPRVLLALGVLAVAAVVGVLAVLALGGDSDETATHQLDARVTTLPLADPTSFLVSGELRGEPLGRVAVVVQRRLGEAPRRGGEPVSLRGFILVTAPGGRMGLHLTGTLALTESGGEIVRARGAAANGTGDFLGLTGSFRLTGGRSDPQSPQSSFNIQGTLEY